MRKFTRRRPRFAPRAVVRSDSRQWGLCGYELALTGGIDPAKNTCQDPFRTWSSIAYPDEEANAQAATVAPRGVVLHRVRFKYSYTLRDAPEGLTSGFYNSLFIRTALVIAPQEGGTPVVSGDGKLYRLFYSNGDLPVGIKRIWMSLDRLSNNYIVQTGLPTVNCYSLPLPLERIRRIVVKEGQGLYWATEVVSGNPALNAHLVSDVVMSYRLSILQ